MLYRKKALCLHCRRQMFKHRDTTLSDSTTLFWSYLPWQSELSTMDNRQSVSFTQTMTGTYNDFTTMDLRCQC